MDYTKEKKRNSKLLKYIDVGVNVAIAGNTHADITLDLSKVKGTTLFIVPILLENPAWIIANVGFNNSNGYYLGIFNSYSAQLTAKITCRVVYI